MKRIPFAAIFLIPIAAAFLSCSGDENISFSDSSQLIGEWNYIREEAIDANGDVVSTYVENNGQCPLDVFDFREQGVLINTDYDFSTNPNQCSGNVNNETWKMSGSTLTLTFSTPNGKFEYAYEIKKGTSSELIIQAPLTKAQEEEYELNVVALKHVFRKM